jgi:aminobenzoyl-glutamate transport protein
MTMTEGNGSRTPAKRSAMIRFLDSVEKIGNRLPHPATLFAIFAFTVAVASWLISRAHVTAVHPGTGETISAVNMISKDGFRFMWTDMTDNFVYFPPLGIVLVAMIGIGVAEGSGLI